MGQLDRPRRRPLIFNTPFETGVRSVVILTACYPTRVSLHRLVVFDHLIVHSGDIDGPPSLHPKDRSRGAELLVRRGLVSAGLALMETRNLISRTATPDGFRYQAGEEAGSFIDLLTSPYTLELKERADWLAQNVMPINDAALADLVRVRIDDWAHEFQTGQGKAI